MVHTDKKMMITLSIDHVGCFQLAKHVFFDKITNDFFVKANRMRESDCSVSQMFDSGSQFLVVALNVLSIGNYPVNSRCAIT